MYNSLSHIFDTVEYVSTQLVSILGDQKALSGIATNNELSNFKLVIERVKNEIIRLSSQLISKIEDHHIQAP